MFLTLVFHLQEQLKSLIVVFSTKPTLAQPDWLLFKLHAEYWHWF